MMSPNDALNRCMQPLRAVIRTGDVNGVLLAEKAVDEFLANIKAGNLMKDRMLGFLTERVVAIEVPDKTHRRSKCFLQLRLTSRLSDLL